MLFFEFLKDINANARPKLNVTQIGHLPKHLGSKVLLDVVGVVGQVSPMGSVKRKSDGGELARRDLTIFDQSGKSVSVTLWQNLASEAGDELDKLQAVRREKRRDAFFFFAKSCSAVDDDD